PLLIRLHRHSRTVESTRRLSSTSPDERIRISNGTEIMSATSDKLVLSNARAVLPNRIVDSASVFVENGIIARIAGERVKSDEHATEIDLSGLTLFPGFIDVHIHGAAGVDTMDASAYDLRRIGEFLARNGVTSWLPTLVPAPDEEYEQAVHAIEEAIK